MTQPKLMQLRHLAGIVGRPTILEHFEVGRFRVAPSWQFSNCQLAICNCSNSHLVFPHVVRVELLEPLLQAIAVLLLVRQVHGLGVIDHLLVDQDRRARAQRQRDRVARPRVDRDRAGRRLADGSARRRCSPSDRRRRSCRRVACRSWMMLRSRSCVIGRGVWMFSICSAMALASNTPTQIGSTFCPSLSRRMMMGMLVMGSTIRPLMFISIITIAPYSTFVHGVPRVDSVVVTSRRSSNDRYRLADRLAPHAVRARALNRHVNELSQPLRRSWES